MVFFSVFGSFKFLGHVFDRNCGLELNLIWSGFEGYTFLQITGLPEIKRKYYKQNNKVTEKQKNIVKGEVQIIPYLKYRNCKKATKIWPFYHSLFVDNT